MKYKLNIFATLLFLLSGCANGSPSLHYDKAGADDGRQSTGSSSDAQDSGEYIDFEAGEQEDQPNEPGAQTDDLSGRNENPGEKPFAPSVPEFSSDFSEEKIIEESGEIWESEDPDWSVSSGAYLSVKNGVGMTIQGDLPETDKWFGLYRKANAEDTDGGSHPQNIFRLVLLKKFLNFSQQAYFRIKTDHLSGSPYRNGSNGLLFFNRYQSSQTLYYTGIRVDGNVTVKKKKNGTYFTLKTEKIFPGVYDPAANPNLLPKNFWLGLKSEVASREDGSVIIKVYLDENQSGKWKLICEAVDDGKTYGGAVLSGAGLAGIRTDFMDVEFDDYAIFELEKR